eukprot:jgi/Tetstr1/448411/TSEL_035681.t1
MGVAAAAYRGPPPRLASALLAWALLALAYRWPAAADAKATAGAGQQGMCKPHGAQSGCTLGGSYVQAALRVSRNPAVFLKFVKDELQCTKRRGREECHAESRAAGAALEARRQREAEAVEVEVGAAPEVDGDAGSWWDRRVWNWHKGYVPADGRPAPLPADALQGEDADIGQVYEVDKCRWDHAYGCGAFSARLSWESVAHACAVELAPAVAESDRLGEALSVQEALRARAARQCTALSHSEVACRSALGGACVWLPPPPPPSSPWPPTPKQYRGLGLDAPPPYVKPRLRKYQPPPMPPPPPPAPHYGYDEPGACQLSSDGHALRPLHALLDCEAAGGLLAAWADYSRGLRDVCGTADTAHACKLLATSGEQPCVWAHRVCRPSVAPLLGALAGEGPVIATKLAASGTAAALSLQLACCW